MKEGEESHPQEKEEQSSSDDDDILLQAAGKWANQRAPTESTHKKEKTNSLPIPPLTQPQQEQQKTWSLHITQLSYNATDFDIRQLFSQKGCLIRDIRLVHDVSAQGKKTFRGVAFVDVANQDSFTRGLELHHSTFLGRRINVRPTKSKLELANIVQQTKQFVANQIMANSQKATGDEKHNKQAFEKQNKKPKRKHSHDKNQNKETTKETERSKKQPQNKTNTTQPHKMSKKERNRKAAIIMSKKRKVK